MSGERPPRPPISLVDSAVDVAALRDGTASPRAIIHVAQAAEHALRRMLRDDPTAPVELRLRALAPEELPLDALLAELRQHNRIPMPLAAGMHELAAAAARAETGGSLEPRDAANAVAVAEGLEAQLQERPAASPLEDPLLANDADVPMGTDEDGEVTVHAVPAYAPAAPWRWVAAALALLAVLALIAWAATRGSAGGGLRRADALAEQGKTASAAALLRQDDPQAPRAAVRLARLYREAGRPTEALRALRDGLAAAPQNPRMHEELGVLLLEQQRPAEATRAFRAALLADSTSERAWVGLVRSLRAGGDAAAAARVQGAAPELARAFAGPAPPPVASPPAP